MKPGLVIGKHGSNLKSIAIETSWTPKVLRTPTMASDTLARVRQLMFNEADFRKKFMTSLGKSHKQEQREERVAQGNGARRLQGGGRSSLLMETPHSKILIDCGLSPEPAIRGPRRTAATDVNKAFPYLDSANLSINELDAVVITHAHMDHIGFVPYLFKYGYEGPVTALRQRGTWQRCCLATT